VRPIPLPANQPAKRFYKGGRRIAEFRGLTTWEEYTPEDWVGSVTSVFGQSPVGLSVLGDGRLLADAITSDPLPWLGPEHVSKHGADTLLLVKLLDAGQRLPIHVHPDDGFAATHLGTAHGKAEAWYILQPGTVYLGLKQSLVREDLLGLIATKEVDTLLDTMNAIEVASGDTVFVPPGTLHAIGAGTFLMEVQQPEDLSILVEWRDFAIDGAAEGHLGLGFEIAARAISLSPLALDDLEELVVRSAPAGETLSARSRRYFRLQLAEAGSRHAVGFAIAIAHRGPATLQGGGDPVRLAAGSTTLIPFGYGDFSVAEGTVLLAKPPALG